MSNKAQSVLVREAMAVNQSAADGFTVVLSAKDSNGVTLCVDCAGQALFNSQASMR